MTARPGKGGGRAGGGGRGGAWVRHTVTQEEVGRTVQEIVTGPMGISRRMIQRLTRAGGLQMNGRAPYLKRVVRPGDVISARVGYAESPGLEARPLPLVVRYEDDHLLVVDKPAGLLVHPVGGEEETTLAHGVAHHLEQAGVRTRVRPVHRLDRDTSGLVLFARSAYAHQALDRQLREGGVRRIYLALVEGTPDPPQQVIDLPIGRHPHDTNLRSVTPEGSPAVTRFRTLRRTGEISLLEVELETGRTHQIRVHLAHLGHPLLGDVCYGGRRGPPGRQALHAARLSLEHPITGEPLEVHSPLPPELERLTPPSQ